MREIVSPLSGIRSPIGQRRAGGGGGAPALSPASLFAAGEQGAWYDPSDLTTLFQDSAGVTPVTAAGQSVGRINDKSGRGNHATQATAASRPVLRQTGGGLYYLEFDGADDFLVSNTTTPGIDKVQVFAGVRKLSDAAFGMVFETSVSLDSSNGTLNLYSGSGPQWTFASRGTSRGFVSPTGFTAPVTNVLTGLGDIAGDSAILRANGAQVASASTDQGTGNYLAYPLYIGRRGNSTLPFNGHIYQLITRFGANLDAVQITQTETFVNARTGAF